MLTGKFSRRLGASVVLLTGFVVPAQAQQGSDSTPAKPPVVLEPLEVTAAREHAAPPPVVTLDLSGAVLTHTPSENPYDLFRRAAAVEVHDQGQGPGFASDVVVGGFTSDHSSDVLLVVDGVPVNQPINGHGEGYADWYSLMPSSVSSLRFIHGAASPLYGNFALGGVVEVFTAADADHTTTAVNGTSHGGVGAWVRTGTRREDGGSMLAVEGRRDRGWRDHSDYDLGNLLLRGWHRAGETGRLEGGIGFYTTGYDSPGFVSVARFNANDVHSATDRTDGGSTTRIGGQGRYVSPVGAHTTLEATAWSYGSRWDLFLNIPESDDPVSQTGERDRRFEAGTQATLTWLPPVGEFTFGVSGQFDHATYTKSQTVKREVISTDADFSARFLTTAAFTRFRRTFGQRFGIDLGGRLDVLDYQSRDRLAGDPRIGDTHAVLSPKLGARYLLGRHLALLGSFSRGFRGAPGVVGDPTRPPILAWASELGADWNPDGVDVHVALFRFDVSNERTINPVTQEITSAGSSVRQGIDVRGRVRLASAIYLDLAGTVNDAKLTGSYADAHTENQAEVSNLVTDRPITPFHDTPLGAGDPVPGVSKYTAQLGLTAVVASKVPLRFSSRILGPYHPIGEPTISTQPYAVFDLSGTVPISGGVSADVGVENLLDRRYAETRASGFLSPGAPRTLRVALTWSPVDR